MDDGVWWGCVDCDDCALLAVEYCDGVCDCAASDVDVTCDG